MVLSMVLSDHPLDTYGFILGEQSFHAAEYAGTDNPRHKTAKRKNKKLRYREEHSASVVLTGVLNDIYRETINISTAN